MHVLAGGVPGGGGDCSDECDSEACPPPPKKCNFISDPVLLPGGQFVRAETDFSMVERGARFVIQRTHLGGDFIDTTAVSEHVGAYKRGRNTLFGIA
jgi:hypothetical protein